MCRHYDTVGFSLDGSERTYAVWLLHTLSQLSPFLSKGRSSTSWLNDSCGMEPHTGHKFCLAYPKYIHRHDFVKSNAIDAYGGRW